MLPPLSAICDYTSSQTADDRQKANDSKDYAGTGSCFRKGEGSGIDYGEGYGQILYGKLAFVGGTFQQIVSVRSLYLRYPVIEGRIQTFPLDDAIVAGGQAAVRDIRVGAAAFFHCFGILNRPPQGTFLAPFQKEVRACQRLALGIYLVQGDLTGTQGVGEGHFGGLTLGNGNSLGIFGFAVIKAALRDQFLNGVFSGKNVADLDLTVIIGCKGRTFDFSTFGICDLELPARNIAVTFHSFDDLQLESDGFIDDDSNITEMFSPDFAACCRIASTYKIPYLYCDLVAWNFQQIPELGIASDVKFVSIPTVCYKSFALNQEKLRNL